MTDETRYADDAEFHYEPVRGLPERLPKEEYILWQGRPSARALARDALGVRWIAGYFALLSLWRVGVSSVELGWIGALPLALPFVALGLLCSGIVYAIAWAQSRATIYTITNERVAMRIGAALTLTLNLPFGRVAGAELDLRRDGTGTIAIATQGDVRLSYLVLWPHVRPWRMKRTEPSLRSVPDAERVAGILADAAETRMSRPEVALAPGYAVAAE